MAKPSGRPLRDEIIETSTRLIQQLGVNGFSYGVLAKELDIKSPSVHHHFRTKEDLVAAVAVDYRERFAAAATAIEGPTATARLQSYARLYSETAKAGRFCLCGAVASEWLAVGEKPKYEVKQFFREQLDYIEAQLTAGVGSAEFRPDLDIPAMASALLAALEGAMLMSRADGAADLPSNIGKLLLSLASDPQPRL